MTDLKGVTVRNARGTGRDCLRPLRPGAVLARAELGGHTGDGDKGTRRGQEERLRLGVGTSKDLGGKPPELLFGLGRPPDTGQEKISALNADADQGANLKKNKWAG